MNIAFSAFLIFLLLAPGLILSRVSRRRGEFAAFVPQPPQPFSIEIATSFFIAAILHGILCGINSFLTSILCSWPKVDFSSVAVLLLGKFGDKDAHLETALDSVTNYPGYILLYFAASFAIAAILGLFFGRKLDWVSRKLGFAPPQDASVAEWKQFFRIPHASTARVQSDCRA